MTESRQWRQAFRLSSFTALLPMYAALLLNSPARAQEPASELQCNAQFTPATPGYGFATVDHPTIPDGEQVRIGEVHLTRLPIFNESDPDEDNFLFRLGNRIHIITRPGIIREQLLFSQGEQVDARLLDETGRLLRRQGYFHDVDVRPVSRCGDEVDVEVITKDNWSLAPTLSFDRQGGQSTYSVGLRDSNLLGRGQLLAITDGRDLDRSSTELLFQDNNVFGTRIRNRVSLINSSDGDTRAFDLDLPFFALDSRRAWALRLKNEQRQDPQFFRGNEVTEVNHEEQDYLAEWGFSAGLRNGLATRWRVGARYQANDFSPSPLLPPPDNFPQDRALGYVFAGLEMIADDYATAFNFDQIYRTEDLHLGFDLSLEFGITASALGSDGDYLVARGSFSDTIGYDADSLWQHSLSFEGFYDRQRETSEDVMLRYENRYFRRQTSHRSFFVRGELVYAHNLRGHRQVVLGAQTSARAFDNRFQVGDRRFVLSVEERLYTDIHLFNLIRVGAAVFADAGRTWARRGETGTEDPWLTDVGFGLRLASSKAASDRVAHLDFAFPLSNRNDPAVDTMLINFTINGSF